MSETFYKAFVPNEEARVVVEVKCLGLDSEGNFEVRREGFSSVSFPSNEVYWDEAKRIFWAFSGIYEGGSPKEERLISILTWTYTNP